MADGDKDGLRFCVLGPHRISVCVDMQRIFAEDTGWKTPRVARASRIS